MKPEETKHRQELEDRFSLNSELGGAFAHVITLEEVIYWYEKGRPTPVSGDHIVKERLHDDP